MNLASILAFQSVPLEEEHTPITRHLAQLTLDDKEGEEEGEVFKDLEEEAGL